LAVAALEVASAALLGVVVVVSLLVAVVLV
jgi:hypothetical protein